jgi:hypothetical protein
MPTYSPRATRSAACTFGLGPDSIRVEIRADRASALASRPESLNLGAMLEPAFDRPPAAVPLDRETLLARFDGIRSSPAVANGRRTSRCCFSTPSPA